MKTEELKDQIIVKYKELTKIYEDYVVANEIAGYNWESDFKNPVNKVLNKLEALKQQLLQAELESMKAPAKIKEKYNCRTCTHYLHSLDEYPCDSCDNYYSKWESKT